MDGKNRIQTALERGQPDMVPIWEMAYNEPSIIGIARYFLEDTDLPEPKLNMDMNDTERFQLLNGLITFVRELDIDGVTAVSLAPRERIDRQHMKDAIGVVYHLSDVGEPYPVDGPISGPSDLSGYRMRSPQESDFLMLDVLRGSFPDRAVAYHMPATFKLSWTLRGTMERLLMDYIRNPKFVHDLARVVTDHCFEVIDIALKKGADFLICEGDLAHNPGPLMSPRHYDEFIGPYHQEICDHVHRQGGKIVKHSDGNLTPLVPGLLNAGFDGIHPIQPQCMDIGETKQKFGSRACILGNIDCSFLLVFGTPEEVKQSVKETIAAAAPGGGYIISSSNSIHPGCRPENYLAMVEAARAYGKYPELAGQG
ncbi:MAG: uroporphyrinogen decarboxylase family protein [Desulfomonilia bacterium]